LVGIHLDFCTLLYTQRSFICIYKSQLHKTCPNFVLIPYDIRFSPSSMILSSHIHSPVAQRRADLPLYLQHIMQPVVLTTGSAPISNGMILHCTPNSRSELDCTRHRVARKMRAPYASQHTEGGVNEPLIMAHCHTKVENGAKFHYKYWLYSQLDTKMEEGRF
jgi:hypothetical protein